MIALQIAKGQVYWARLHRGKLEVLCGTFQLPIDGNRLVPYPLMFAGFPAAKAWGRFYAEREEMCWRPPETLERFSLTEAATARIIAAITNRQTEIAL